MKRIQRVEQLLVDQTIESLERAHLQAHRPLGLTAEWTGEQLVIDRSNASRDLNALVQQKRAIKIGGKPVLFLSFAGLERKFGRHVYSLQGEYDAWASFLQALQALQPVQDLQPSQPQRPVSLRAEPPLPNRTAFDALPGKSRSLKKPIDLAKAAMLYPPNGLHTLLTGPTGVGKTLFAESMYRFAVETGRLDAQAPFVDFNCADYANNSHLLLAQLFGVEKGAYTGADRDRAGLVEKADGGVLFLDELHRLPPEGQEMLFQLLDRGVYRRLGESDSHRTAKVRLIGATTESVHSALLMTFVRRIPMLIPIPALAERTLEERFLLVQDLFSEESARVQRPFWIAPEVMKALLLFDCPANVGQLKSEIQLLSARSFLSQMQSSDPLLSVTLEYASDQVRAGLLRGTDKRKELETILHGISKGLVVNGDRVDDDAWPGHSEDGSLYERLERQAQELRRRGLTEEELNHLLSADIDRYFRTFLTQVSREFASRRQDVVQLVGESMLEAVEGMFDLASTLLDRVFASQTVFGSALHMRSAVERLKAGFRITNPGLANMRKQAPEEYRTAQQMAHFFTERMGIVLPDEEIGFLSTILTSTLEANPKPKVGVLVVTHGDSTGSSMLQSAQHLLGALHGEAIDMPLHMEREEVVELAVEAANRMNEGQGLLLLVDMGTLVTLGEELQERTGIEVKTLANVSTLAVMEAVRKAALSHATLDRVYATVKQLGTVWERSESTETRQTAQHGVLPVVCVTGQGSAMQLKAILEERLVVPDDYDLQIVPVAIRSFEESPDRLQKLLHNRKPLAIVGTLNPNLPEVPFITAQDVLIGDGLQRISHLIGTMLASDTVMEREKDAPSIWDSLLETFRQTVKRVNPYFVVPLILEAFGVLEQRFERKFDLDIRIGVTMHLVMALERRLLGGDWLAETRESPGETWTADMQTVLETLEPLSNALEIVIPAAEIRHLLRLLLQEMPQVQA